MNTLSGPFTHDNRDLIALTGETVAMIPVPGATDLSQRLSCIAQTRNPSRALLAEAATLAKAVLTALLAEASPDRWLTDVAGIGDEHLQRELVADLIAQRHAQAAQVSDVLAILNTVTTRLPVTA